MTPTDEQFNQAANQWDLETLYTDLASAKGKRLTPVEKLHLRGLLCGYSPSEIAAKLQKTTKGVETDLCATLYKYVKSLVGKSTEKIENWRNIAEWLDDSGYKSVSSAQIPANNRLSEKGAVNVTNINFENNQLTIGVYFQLTIPLPAEISIQNFESSTPEENNCNN